MGIIGNVSGLSMWKIYLFMEKLIWKIYLFVGKKINQKLYSVPSFLTLSSLYGINTISLTDIYLHTV